MRLFARVSYSYGQREALKDVEIEARRSELLAIIGPNGAGKSTLLKSLVGILRPKGKVELDGVDLLSLKPAERAKLITYVPQSSFPEFLFTVEEFVEMGSYMTGGSVEEALKKVGLWERRRDRITALSGGEFQLALIARALAQGSRAVLLDEPTSHLDVNHALTVMELLRELKGEKIIITVLHDVNLALEYADRLIVMKDGEKFWEGKPGKITPDILERVYGVRAKIVEVDSHRVFLPELAKV
ncbi:ABC transporter ATP-binding protein [Thermococcus stetteri]|uniref:ABC transporter ATP-binding protein n=1 Tax=Thermococcus stetteri TaxID=49900 RepID=UPI001AEB97EC|nr:ABC transporter ATP-binding protein [Thermococcus stetteri]MBP1911222.1 iron complex transport system ATP-binding protein [Thermococcus stetteri]